MKLNLHKKPIRVFIYSVIFLLAMPVVFATAPSGPRPGPCNTGPSGTLTVIQGPLDIYTPGTTLENVHIIGGPVTIWTNNVTLRNFKIDVQNKGDWGIWNRSGTGHLYEDGEIVNTTGNGVVGNNYTARRLEIHESGGDGFKAGSNTIIENNWVHHLGWYPEAHADGVQILGGFNIQIRNNYFDCPYPTTAPYKINCAIFIKCEGGPGGSITIEENYLNGGAFIMQIRSEGYGCPSNTVVRNNHFSGKYQFGAFNNMCGTPSYGNIYDPAGTSTIPACGGGAVADTQAPSVPSGLAVTGSGIASVSLSWNASTDNIGVTGYRIYVNGTQTQTSSGTSATIGGLNPSTSYNFTVAAYDAVGNVSAQSSSVPGSTQSGSVVSVASVTASSNDGNIPANTLDDNLATRWSADGDGQWIQYQLSAPASLTAMGIAFYNGASRSSSFDIQVSSNGTSWTNVYSGSSSGTTTNFEVFDFSSTTASYIRYLGHGNSVNSWNSLTEVKIYAGGPADTQAPSTPTGLATGTVTTSSVDLSWNASTDNIGVTGYKVYTNGANPQTVGGTSTTISGLADNTQYTFTVSAIDAASNESAQSSSVQATTDEITGVTSNGTFQSFTESTQTGEFTATFTSVPGGNNIDAITGIQNGSASAYGDLACIIRFNSSGNIDARNGSAYAATNTVSYSSGVSYSFRVEVNVTSHTYSVYVTPQGGSEQTVASNFAFRTEQASVSQLTGWTVYAYVGSHTVDNMVFDDGSTPDTQAPSVPTGLSSSNVTHNSVDLSWTASTDDVGVTGYKVYTNGSNPVTVGGTSTTISGLSAETQYSFTVSAIDAANNESAQSSAEVVTTDEVPSAPNLISNGEFDSGTTDWFAGNYAGTATISAVTGQGMSGTNALQVSISAAGTNPWDIQIYQDFAIENGKSYEISFQAKAASNRDIDAVIQDTDSPWAEYWHEDISLTTSAQTFGPYTFNSSITDATCRFKFFVAGNASVVYVDNVVITDVTGSSAEAELTAETSSFKVYPNPLNGNTLNVEVNGYNSDMVNVVIFDMLGRTVYNNVHNVTEQARLQIPNNLNKGIYVISVNNKQQKLVVE